MQILFWCFLQLPSVEETLLKSPFVSVSSLSMPLYKVIIERWKVLLPLLFAVISLPVSSYLPCVSFVIRRVVKFQLFVQSTGIAYLIFILTLYHKCKCINNMFRLISRMFLLKGMSSACLHQNITIEILPLSRIYFPFINPFYLVFRHRLYSSSET
jgi:hypothetical protein